MQWAGDGCTVSTLNLLFIERNKTECTVSTLNPLLTKRNKTKDEKEYVALLVFNFPPEVSSFKANYRNRKTQHTDFLPRKK